MHTFRAVAPAGGARRLSTNPYTRALGSLPGGRPRLYGMHPYLDPYAFLGFLGVEQAGAECAREAAAVLGYDYVNDRLLDAVRWGADEYAQTELACQLAAEARQRQMDQQMEAAAQRAREAEAARRRASAEALLL